MIIISDIMKLQKGSVKDANLCIENVPDVGIWTQYLLHPKQMHYITCKKLYTVSSTYLQAL